MKKILILAIAVSAAAFIGCGSSNNTELSFTNSNNSDGAINDIVWNTNEVTWSQTNGYARNTTTESKEVSSTTGSVGCNVIIGSDVIAADVTFPDNTSGTGSGLSLKDGSSNNYTLQATQPN
jgi:heat shock protein HslJ